MSHIFRVETMRDVERLGVKVYLIFFQRFVIKKFISTEQIVFNRIPVWMKVLKFFYEQN